jgi:hypothetical protein
MGLRYPLAVVFAYIVFLCLLRLWLAHHRNKTRVKRTDDDVSTGLDALDFIDADLISSGGTEIGEGSVDFGGGASGGGGASQGFAASLGDVSENAGSSAGSSFSFDFDADDLWIVVLIIAAIGGALFASIYVIVSAPAFLAEIFVDGVLATGLYKCLQKINRQHWLETTFRKTWLPVLIVALLFTIAGYFIQQLAPEADSIGDLWR